MGLDGSDDVLQHREVTIMQAQTPCQLPYSLDGIQVGTIGRKEVEFKMARLPEPPSLVEARVVIVGIVRDDHDPASGSTRGLPQLLHKAEECLFVEAIIFPSKNEPAILQTNRAEVAHTVTRRMVQQHRILDLRGHPHSTARAVLLKVNLIECPQIHGRISGQTLEFFYARASTRGQHSLPPGEACAAESRVAGTSAGIGARPAPPRISAQSRRPASCRPRGS